MTPGAPVRRGLLAVIGFYSRAISPALPPRCRFHPTCSAYAAEAIGRYGAGRGSWLALRRILKCAPWHPGGVDLVPAVSGSGTAGEDQSSSPEVPPAQARPADPLTAPARPDRATPPASRRANEETSVV
ncbi:membrane protein insertion efficiency factor YidD [Candidatus Blastococcus massiliensis]|uniref:membrane protein insertion efficiency factor YidD n=1 Tax=Candidatus Blastococcus massiliensis TaxID=1470358 RepID=UPI0018CC3AFC|nr:membrane protein insertion efficiency factor YidD [Candidatus Blastococcus massiliensis]